MKLSLIVAVSTNGIIGRDGGLPWRLPADLRRFKRLTMGHHLIMGRKTYEAVGRPLPGRTTIVVSRGRPKLPAAVRLAGSLDEAIEMAQTAGDTEAFIAGGGEIYRLALPRVERIYLTRIHAEVAGDAWLPEVSEPEWRTLWREDHPPDERHAHAYSFLVLERRNLSRPPTAHSA